MTSTPWRAVTAAAVTVLIGQWAMAPPALAAPCGTRSELVRKLDETFLEKRRAIALMNNGNLLEVFVSKGGSWTIIVSNPYGRGCVVAAGDSWQDDTIEPGEQA